MFYLFRYNSRKKYITAKLSLVIFFILLALNNLLLLKVIFFVNCPLCREVNSDIDYPNFKDSKKNLLLMCHPGVTKVQCNHTTISGRRCKKKSHLFNYVRRHIHNKENTTKSHYYI